MAWIESHQSLGHHPKTLRLAAELKCSVPCAIGYLHMLWWWALDYAPDGLLTAADKPVVARACMWSKKSELFWAALLSAGFVEQTGEELRIHDWMDYAGRLVQKREANAERQRRFRDAHVTRTKHARNAHVTGLPTNQPELPVNNAAAVAVNSRSRARAQDDDTAFQPMSALIEDQQQRRRQHEDLPEEVRERLARPPITVPSEGANAHG
jgi:hypothetical protein